MSGMSVTLSIHNTTRVPVLANIPSQDHHHTVILATMWQWRSWCSDSGEEDYSGVTVVEGPVVWQQCSATIWQWWRWRPGGEDYSVVTGDVRRRTRPACGICENSLKSATIIMIKSYFLTSYHHHIIIQSMTLVRLLWSWWQLWDFIIIIIVKSRDCTCKENLRDSWLLCKNVKTSKQYFIIEGNPLCRGISAYI